MESDKSYGPIIGLVIIIIIIALGSVYFLGQRDTKIEDKATTEQLDQINDQSSSDELADIEADLEATDLSDLDAELSEIEAELDASVQ